MHSDIFLPIKGETDAQMMDLRGNLKTTLGSRTGDRNRRILLTGAAGVIAKFVSVAATFITMPVTLHYLGAERFGLWMTMSSLVAFLTFADFGIGNGLLSAVASANGRDDMSRVRVLVSSAYFGLSLIALALLTVFAASYGLVPWAGVFNVSDALAKDEVGASVAALIVCFACTIPLSIVARTQMGLQMGFISNLWQCGSSLLTLGAVLLAVHFLAPLPVLVLAYVGAPLSIHVLNSLVFFLFTRPDIAPNRSAIDIAALRAITKIGLMFAVLQVLAAITYLSDNFIISHMLGPEYVAQYAVPEKLFAIITTLTALALAPLWPAYGEASARGDTLWILATFRRSIVVAGASATIAATFLIFASPTIIEYWIGGAIMPKLMMLLGLSAWKIAEVLSYCVAMLLNGMHYFRTQVVLAILAATSSVPIKMQFVAMFGINGIPWAMPIVILVLVLPAGIIVRHQIKRGGK